MFQLCISILYASSNFFPTPKLKPPLLRRDALSCLYDLVVKVCKVLYELHITNKVAHLDVRLDNICFSESNCAVIIDFDRCCPASEAIKQSLFDKSVLYKAEHIDWTCEQLDWKQLGLMIAWIITDYKDYHQVDLNETLSDELNKDKFLTDLLYEGQFWIWSVDVSNEEA